MKKLYLHTGFGKTGSSAIQSWLARRSDTLKKHDFSFKVLDANSVNFNISVGNGGTLVRFLQDEISADELYKEYFNHKFNNTIISSEVLALTPGKIKKLNSFCKEKKISIKYIGFVRDAFDLIYSTYVQRVKRHNYCEKFDYFLENNSEMYHIKMANMLHNHCEDVILVHYNKYKGNILAPFCKILGLKYPEKSKDHKRRVNRSLSPEEIHIIQMFVKWRKKYCDDLENFNISMLISDWLVNTFHDRTYDTVITQNQISKFTEKYTEILSNFNSGVGKAYNIELKLLNNSDYSISKTDSIKLNNVILSDVVNFLIENANEIGSRCLTGYAKELQKIDIELSSLLLDAILTMPKETTPYPDKYIEPLKLAATQVEKINVNAAHDLIELALNIRPSGPILKRRLKAYSLKLQEHKK